MKNFINLPRLIYQDDEYWVPPLWMFEKSDYKASNNSILSRSEHSLFLAYKNSTPVGRIIAYIDPRYNSHFNSSTGMFGSFESISDKKVSSLLFTAAENWLREHGMNKILGPINPVAESWGFLFENPTHPVYLSPHNPLYYNRLISDCAYTKAKDLIVYEADAGNGYIIPERFSNFSDKILERNKNLSIRTIDRKNLHRDALHILNIFNKAIDGNWGYVPVEEKEMVDIVNQLKLIMDEQTIAFVEDKGQPVAASLAFPDINIILKKTGGRLNPSGILALLRGRKKIKDYRLWGLAVLPEYQGQGLDVLLYVDIARYITPLGGRLEANYMLEDNPAILNALKKMGLSCIKKYRVYEKTL